MKKIVQLFIALIFTTGITQNAPIDFEPGGFGDTWTWIVFENGNNPPLEIITNPYPSGINTSATVAKFTARDAGTPFAGVESTHGSDLGSFDLTAENALVSIMVWKTKISDIGIKFATPSGGAQPELKVANTLINQWELINIDFSGYIGLGETTGLDQIIIFPDFIDRTADDIIYFDNITFGPVSSAVELPITFEDGQTPLFGDFGGSATTIIPNPDASGINTTATVADNLVPAGLEYAGVNFPVAVDLTTDKYFKLQVWASEINTPILVKLEREGTPVERLVQTTTSNQWEELVFDFSGDTVLSYTSVTLFMNFDTGAGNPAVTTYWDNLELFTPEVDYCGPLEFPEAIEPITLVLGAGINNATSAVVDGTPANEDFTGIVGFMDQGGTFTMDIEGNTDGAFTSRVVIFIDWNQNMILDDEGEVYEFSQTLYDSDGTDGQFVSKDIVVPVNAALGETRMRVKKISGATNFLDPCLGSFYGQAEDYTISVGVLSTNDNVIEGFSYYPNPSYDVINLSAKQNIEKAAIYNILGQKVIDQNINATSSRLNVANLNTGTYLMQVRVDGKTATYKIIKN